MQQGHGTGGLRSGPARLATLKHSHLAASGIVEVDDDLVETLLSQPRQGDVRGVRTIDGYAQMHQNLNQRFRSSGHLSKPAMSARS